MSKTYFEERQNPFLWVRLILDTVWDELKNILSLGVRLRRQRDLAIAPGEVIVVDGTKDGPSKIAAHVIDIARWWGFGSARARNTVEFSKISTTQEVLLSATSRDEVGPEFEPGSFPKVWLLTCRHGHEIAFARRLRRHVRRVSRRSSFSHPIPFITAVPFIHLESTSMTVRNLVVGPQLPDEPQNWTPTLGIFDSDIDEAALRTVPQPPKLTWHGTVMDQGQNMPLTVSTRLADRVLKSHGTAVAAIAASKARVDIHCVGFRSDHRKASWLPATSASFLLKALETLKDCDVINLSLTVDRTVSDVAARFEDVLSWILAIMVESGTVVVSAVGKGRLVKVQEPSGDYRQDFIKIAGVPASLPYITAVGSDDPLDRNEGVLGRHFIVHFDAAHHLCIVDGKPFVGSSAACAYVSGQICNNLGASPSAAKTRLERAQEVGRRRTHASFPGAKVHAAWTNEVTYINAT